MVSTCFQFERGQNFPFDWPASVSNILTVRKWAEPKIVGRNFTSRIRPLSYTSMGTASKLTAPKNKMAPVTCVVGRSTIPIYAMAFLDLMRSKNY